MQCQSITPESKLLHRVLGDSLTRLHSRVVIERAKAEPSRAEVCALGDAVLDLCEELAEYQAVVASTDQQVTLTREQTDELRLLLHHLQGIHGDLPDDGGPSYDRMRRSHLLGSLEAQLAA